MVEFLENVKGSDFQFEAGKRYVSMESPTEELKDWVLVRQSNSPKRENWWCRFKKSCIGSVFNIIEGTREEQAEENKLLQL